METRSLGFPRLGVPPVRPVPPVPLRSILVCIGITLSTMSSISLLRWYPQHYPNWRASVCRKVTSSALDNTDVGLMVSVTDIIQQFQVAGLSYLLSFSGPWWPSWDGSHIILVFGSLGGLLKRRLPAASLKDSGSSKDNLIETRTKIIVGAMPW